MSFIFDVFNSSLLLFVFLIILAPGLSIAYVIGEKLGKPYAIAFAVIYSFFFAATLKALLPHVPLLD